MDLKEKIIGAWKLIHYEYPVDGVETKPLGENPTGFLTYTPDGYISANMMTSNERPKYSSQDLHQGTVEEMSKAAEGYVAYAGQFEIKEIDEAAQTATLIHHMAVSLNPTWLGDAQERYVTYDEAEDTITIRASSNDALLVWRKAENHRPA